ncbi:MAG: hypothetical protein UY34_C0007G0023 [Parcubacteria group bacterium GW2011_GWA2_48_9]|nr:MAG: hypothetical protein UY34_C0007G0023 [Parcubacteria group bacterium GW2011_GWA2_48_9]
MENINEELLGMRASDVDLGVDGVMESLAKLKSELAKLREMPEKE